MRLLSCESNNSNIFKLNIVRLGLSLLSTYGKDVESKMRNHAVVHSSDVEEGRGKESQIVSIETKKSFYTKLYKLTFCFLGLQVSYVFWGLVQEHLMTHEYALGKFHSSAFLVFANRFLALIISLGIVLFQRVMHPTKQTLKDVPFYYYAPSSLSNTISSWAQYEALKYVSFPTQVLSKSCKIIPVMLVCCAEFLFDIKFGSFKFVCMYVGWYFAE